MNKLKLASVFILFMSMSNLTTEGQTYIKSEEPYKSKSGKIFKIGDTIVVASPADFTNDFMYFFQGKNLQTKVQGNGITVINGTNYPYRNIYTKRIIKHFKIYPEYGTFAVFDNVFNVMINIEKGIEYGEIQSEIGFLASNNKSKHLNDSTAYQEFAIREKVLVLNHYKEYLYLFENTIYTKVREDEFEFHKQIKQTEKKLLNLKSQIDTSQIFKIGFADEIGNFDFEKSAFPIIWKNNGISLLDDNWEVLTPEDINKNKISLTDLRINFINTKKFPLLPIQEEKANYLVKRRKNENGDVDRKIYMQIHLKIKELKDGKNTGLQPSYVIGEKYLMCEILKIDFFEDKFPAVNFINSVGSLIK